MAANKLWRKYFFASIFATDEPGLVNTLHKGFGDRIGISIKSMDTDIKEAV